MSSSELDFTGRVVIVTGGTKGIGKVITTSFLEHGADVVICARNAPEEPVRANGKEAVEKARTLRPEVILMDLTMPIMDGLEATRQVRQAAPESKVLMLTMHRGPDFMCSIVETGASGYLLKTSSREELLRAIRAIHRGGTCFTPALGVDTSAAKLTLREREVLALIADGYSNQAAALALGIAVRTVERHRERVMQKLNCHSVVELTRYAVAHGLVKVS